MQVAWCQCIHIAMPVMALFHVLLIILTVLSFTTFLLCKHPEVFKRVREEVDAHFKADSKIDITACQSLGYLLAVIDESMRLYPAAPGLPSRVTPDGGAEVFGHWVQEDVSAFSNNWVKLLLTINFSMADRPDSVSHKPSHSATPATSRSLTTSTSNVGSAQTPDSQTTGMRPSSPSLTVPETVLPRSKCFPHLFLA